MISIQSTLLLASVIALVLFVKGGEAIRCYECNSHQDSRCAEAKPPAELGIDCGTDKRGAEFPYCRKIVQVIEFGMDLLPETRIFRKCAFLTGIFKNKCYDRSGYGGREKVCACDSGDLCNDGM